MVIPEAREISKMSKNHNNALCRGEFGVPTLFDLFSRPLSAFSGFDMENEGFKADVEDKGDRYQVKAEMPGVKKEDIKLSFDDGVLTIKAEHNTEKKEGSEKKGYLVEECSYGTYERSFRFDDADPSDISAAFANGELDVCLKKAPKKQPNAIKIN
jgi:HSP20 family protein